MRPTSVEWFRYQALSQDDASVRPSPLLQVVFALEGRTKVTYGLVDSGSEMTCLPGSIARDLGCALSDEIEEVRVFGAVVRSRSAVVDLRVATAFGVLSFPGIECSVPLSDQGVDFAVLGRDPLFREVEVRFQEWLERFGFQRRREFLQGPGWTKVPSPRGAPPTVPRSPGRGRKSARRSRRRR